MEIAYFEVLDVYEVKICVPTDVNELTYDYWIPNTEQGYNDKWRIEVKKNKVPVSGMKFDLSFDEPYEDNNEGDQRPVFLSDDMRVISHATTNADGIVSGVRFGWRENPGRVGNVYRLRARIAGRSEWVESAEKDYLGVYDKRLLDVAQTYCNNEEIEDWTGRQCEVDDPPITDAVAYSFGAKDALEHFNADMQDWQTVMNTMVEAKWDVQTCMVRWKNTADGIYDELFPGDPADLDPQVLYDNMVEWRNRLRQEFVREFPAPDPVEDFNDDAQEWNQAMGRILSGFPNGPASGNAELLMGYISQINTAFEEMFPFDTPQQWTTTLAWDSLWVNYRIDTYGNLNSDHDIKSNSYRVRLNSSEYNTAFLTQPAHHSEYHISNWAGIDCSGLLQRAAGAHTSLPDLGTGRFTWMGSGTWPNARNCNQIENGYSGSQYSSLIGLHPEHSSYVSSQDTYSRLAPGDLIIKAGHVAIVNFISGDRGEKDANSDNVRDDTKIHLIQAISQKSDDPDAYPNDNRRDGLVTDTWNWRDFGKEARKAYHARRLLP